MKHNIDDLEPLANKLTELAARCEAATGPDRELDALIESAIPRFGLYRYTASIDAAMTLVPEGWTWGVFDDGTAWVWPDERRDLLTGKQAKAATPALALCAATLRARAQQEDEK